jgi:coat protein B
MFKTLKNAVIHCYNATTQYVKEKLGLLHVVTGTSLVMVAGSSHAALADDVTAAIASFAEVNTAIPVVGAAFLLALGILAAWKLVRGAFA